MAFSYLDPSSYISEAVMEVTSFNACRARAEFQAFAELGHGAFLTFETREEIDLIALYEACAESGD